MTEDATGKKDILEFPLEDVEVPQAIRLMMSAATAVPTYTDPDEADERLAKLCEKLEFRVEDAIEDVAKRAQQTNEVAEEAPDEEPVDETDIFLMNEGLTMNYKGLLFHRTCNAPVTPEGEGNSSTYCALMADHLDRHVDLNGDSR